MEFILHFWTKIFGTSVMSVRFPSMLFGCLTAVMIFFLGWRIRSMSMGLIAALIFSFAKWPIYFSHEVRVYALFALLTVSSLYFLLALRANPRSIKHWIAYTLATVLLAYSHYFGFVVIGWEILWLLMVKHPEPRSFRIRILVAFGLLALAYLPHALTMIQRVAVASSDHFVPLAGYKDGYHTISKFMNQPLTTVVGLVLLGLAGMKWCIRRFQGKAKVDAGILLLLGIFPGGFLMMWLVGMQIPVFLDRYTIFSIMGLYLVLALSIMYLLSDIRWQLLSGLVMVVLFLATTDFAMNPRSEWAEVAHKIHALRRPKDVVLISPSWNYLGFTYHYDQTIFKDYNHITDRMHAVGIWGIMEYTTTQEIDIENASAVWIVSAGSESAPLHPSIRNLLSKAYHPQPPIEGNYKISIVGYEENLENP